MPQIAVGRALDHLALIIDQFRLHAEEGPRGGARLQIGGARQRT